MINFIANNKQTFIQKYFQALPIQPKSIDYNEYHIINFKKDICDLYYNIIKLDSINFNKFFYSLLFYEDSYQLHNSSNQNIAIPGISIWQNKFFEFLQKSNKKPTELLLFTSMINILKPNSKFFKYVNITIHDENSIEPIKNEFMIENLPIINNMLTPRIIDIKEYPAHKINPDNYQNSILLYCIPEDYTFNNKDKLILDEISRSNHFYFLIMTSPIITNNKIDDTINQITNLGISKDKCYIIKQSKDHYFSVSAVSFNQSPFPDDLLDFQPIKLDKTNIDEIFLECSNCLKQYADHLISNESYFYEGNFFFLESLRFSKKAMDLRMEYARELEKKAEWEKVIDELAHSLNTNIGAARDSVHSIQLESSDPGITIYSEEAENFMREAAELVDLTLDSLKLEINITTLTDVSLTEIIEKQINTIQKGITTLRFSTNKHLQNVKNMTINFSLDDSIKIQTYAVAANLIIKDLLKNAILNTDQNSPEVSIKSNKIDNNTCLLSITNNKAISKEWADWINFDIEGEEIRMSKSRRVGMRVVKRWKPKLRWQIFVSSNEINSTTTTTVTIPLYAYK